MKVRSNVAAVVTMLLGVASSAAAGLIVVDPANGPGTDFMDLQPALQAAAHGDVLLIRDGTYTGPFTVTGMSVSLVADEGASVTLQTQQTGTASLNFAAHGGGDAVLRGISFRSSGGGAAALRIAGASTGGIVFVEDCQAVEAGNVGIVVDGVRPIHLVRCHARGSNGTNGIAASPGMQLVGSVPIAMFGGSVKGGDGIDSNGASSGTDGAHAVLQLQNPLASVRVFSAVEVVGGDGGDGAHLASVCAAEGFGGDGYHVVKGGGIHLIGGAVAGGQAGLPGFGCPSLATPGDEVGVAAQGQPAVLLPGLPASVVLPRVRHSGMTATLELDGTVGDDAWLVLGGAPLAAFVPSASGELAVSPLFVVPLGKLPAGGLAISGTVPSLPPTVEHAFLYAQVVTRDASGQTVIGSPSAMLVLP